MNYFLLTIVAIASYYMAGQMNSNSPSNQELDKSDGTTPPTGDHMQASPNVKYSGPFAVKT